MENELAKLQRIDRELAGQNQVLEMLATGKSLTDILNALMGTLESQISGTQCSILILDASGQYLNLESGPSLPEPYREILKDIKIGPDAGICGTAAYKNEFVFSEDIEHDPRCACFKVLALAHNLRACGSTPIKNIKGQVLGTLCLYSDQPRKPDEIELNTLNHAAYLAGIALQFKQAEALRKKAEEDLQHAQEESARFGRLLDNSSNETYTFDIATLKFTQVNYGARKNLGYTMEELSEMTPADLKPDYPTEKFEELIKPLRQGEKKRITFQTVHKRKNGTTYPVEGRLQLMHDENPPVFFAVIEDITERKKIEQHLSFVEHGVEYAADGAFWLEADSARLVYVNSSACQNLGYSREELLGMTVFDIDPNFPPEVWPAHMEVFKKEKKLNFETRHQRKDGTIFPVEINSHYVVYEGKEYSVAFSRDITDRKKNEAEIIQARDAAEKANQAKSKFLSRMSHELRTPMNAILGFAQIMDLDPENKLDGQYRESVRYILTSGQHLKRLIDDVLDLTVVESGNLELSLESIPVAPVVREIISQMEPLRKLHDIRITAENLTESEHTIFADRMRFQQIMINLISNAIKYNRKGGTVSIAVGDNPDQTVSICVQDTGQGIPKENMGDLFEPFNRLNFENGEIEGTGIGLNIVRDLVSLMKGTLEVESAVGEGSSFTVSFPLGDSTKIKSDRFAEPDSPEESVPVIGPIQILYIEDDPTNSRLVENIVSIKPNLILKTAETAEKGIEIAKAQNPHIILMDIRLPGIDGFEAFQRLRSDSQTQSIPVVAVTAHAMPADIKKAMDMGFDSYLAKPLDVPLFLQTIEKHSRKL